MGSREGILLGMLDMDWRACFHTTLPYDMLLGVKNINLMWIISICYTTLGLWYCNLCTLFHYKQFCFWFWIIILSMVWFPFGSDPTKKHSLLLCVPEDFSINYKLTKSSLLFWLFHHALTVISPRMIWLYIERHVELLIFPISNQKLWIKPMILVKPMIQ